MARQTVAQLKEEIELLQKELETRNYACGDALDKLWQEVVLSQFPGYGDWEYPGQAYNHLRFIYGELMALAQGGMGLSGWAAAVNWNGGRNTQEWLTELKRLIEAYQKAAGKVIGRTSGEAGAAMSEEEKLMAKLALLDLADDAQRNYVVCALIGHSRIQTSFFGYFNCGRCGDQLGDNLGGVYPAGHLVIVGHDCPTCRANYETLTWKDKLFVPVPFNTAVVGHEEIISHG